MKNIILAALILISCNLVKAKKTITDPKFSASSTNNIRINMIDLDELETVLYITIHQPEGSDVLVSSKTYIQSSDGGDKLFVSKAEGITLDATMPVPRSRKVTFILHFPKLAKEVNRINFRAGEDGNYWHVFELVVNPNLSLARNLPEPEIGYRKLDGKKWKYILNPRYAAKKANGLKIVKIELMDTATVVHFEYQGVPNNWISIPSQTCIQPGEGGKLLFVKGSDGIPFDEKIIITENTGIIAYKLYFPKIEKGVKTIHFKEVNPSGSWFFFDIEI